MMGLTATPLDPGELSELARSLSAAALPIADLDEPGRAFFRFTDDTDLVGYGGIEGKGADRLLRSW